MNFNFFLVGVFLVSVTIGNAQDTQPAKAVILYDPLFWKDELKLNALQCQKIKEINSEYYEKLWAVVHEESNRKTVQVRAAQSLLERSEEIWETFYPKQRKRWKRMWPEDTPHTI